MSAWQQETSLGWDLYIMANTWKDSLLCNCFLPASGAHESEVGHNPFFHMQLVKGAYTRSCLRRGVHVDGRRLEKSGKRRMRSTLGTRAVGSRLNDKYSATVASERVLESGSHGLT